MFPSQNQDRMDTTTTVVVLFLVSGLVVDTVMSALVIYPHPDGVQPSDKFKVSVSQGGGHKQDSFVYMSSSDHRVHDSKDVVAHRTVSWTSFAFGGAPVTVEVTTSQDFHNCLVRPKSYSIDCHRTGPKRAQFVVTQNTRQMSVEFDNDYGSVQADIRDKLLVFADPPETDVPGQHASHVLYFGPGLHDLHGQKELDGKSITEVYLAPGAFVQGAFKATGGSVKIHGRGVISNSAYSWHDKRIEWAVVLLDKGSHHTLEGVTLVDPSMYFVRALSSNNLVSNIKTVGAWTHNSDGVSLGHDGVLQDSFIMANDDAVKLYSDNMEVRRLVIWQSTFGAVFQTGWWSGRDLHKVRVTDVDVIHIDWCAFRPPGCPMTRNLAVFDEAGKTSRFDVSDISFSNLRIEGRCPRFVNFQPVDGATGTVANVNFDNVSIESQPAHDPIHNVIGGTAGLHETNWHFHDLVIGGHCVSNPNQGDFQIDAHTTSNIRFSCGGAPIVG